MIPKFKPKLGWTEFFALFKRNNGAVQKFEIEFAKAFQSVDAVAFSYGRSAQWAFFKALEIENAEVIMPAYTCSVVAHAVSLSNNIPRFVDIKKDDFNMNLDLVPALINERTRAIIATHTFGYPQDVDRIKQIVKDAELVFGHKIWIIQDCCHCFGAEWNSKLVGTQGDVAVYAFNISKLMTSIFGGMLTFQDQALAEKVREWRDLHFLKPTIFKSIKRRVYLVAVYIAFQKYIYGFTWWLQEKTSFLNKLTKSFHLDDKIHFPPDYLDNMMDVEAKVGLEQLIKYRFIIDLRRTNSQYYNDNLNRKISWIYPKIQNGATYSHFAIIVPNKEAIIKKMARYGVHLGELIQYSIPNLYSYNNLNNNSPESLFCSHNVINLPLTVSKKEIKRITQAINSFID
jgi:dTDP-4-amino-4,6-dideoxygalactose transaminase